MTNVLFSIYVATIVIYFVLLIFKTLFFKTRNIKDYINILGIIGIHVVLCLTFSKLLILFNSLFIAFSIALITYLIITIFKARAIDDRFHHLSNRLIKNAPFDYYFATDKDDIIYDYSDSFKTLVNLTDEDLVNSLGFQTLISCLNIQTFNFERFNETKALKLDFEYRSTMTSAISRFFEISILDGNETVNLSFVIEPVFLNNQFIGRNIYISKDNKESLDHLESGLLDAKEQIKQDRAALYCMMSMIDGVIMYYDYNCNKYLISEAACKKYNMVQRELSISEFVALIHPDDLDYYAEQNEIMTSLEVTRISYRLKLGSDYVLVNDDAMYLNKDQNLLSLISLYQEGNSEVKTLNEVNEIDYKAKLEEVVQALAKEIAE